MSRHLLPLIATLFIATACGDANPVAPTPPEDPPPPRLTAGTWALASAEGRTLPALIGERTVNGVTYQVHVDSGRLVIAQDGSWSQRLHLRTVAEGKPVFNDTWIDGGTALLEGDRYRLRSTGGTRTATVDTRTPGRLDVLEMMLIWPGAPLTSARYVPWTGAPPGQQPQEPTPITNERWVATAIEGQPLPAPAYVFLDEPTEGAATEYWLDSATVTLRSDGRYARKLHYSEWQTPNYEFSMGFFRARSAVIEDHGTYSRTGADITLTSAWIQNWVVSGSFAQNGQLTLRHGLEHGDPSRAVTYVKR